MEYINKSVLVAEIKKRLEANGAFDEIGDEAWFEDKGMCSAYKSILSFINTLEVKEMSVDMEDSKKDKSEEIDEKYKNIYIYLYT